ncbi:MAG TPA: hypothetical protein VER12_06440 [Polyangiaceae bacterium]|nr:hypothetical protein [Polyangiaceae bacterium]
MSRSCVVGFGFAALAVWMAACAAAPAPAETPEPPPAASPRPSASVASAKEPLATPATQQESPPAAASSAPPAAPAPAAILPICLAKCDKLVSRCGTPTVESCRLNCGKYDPPPAACGDQVRAALECARDARDLSCANVAPESCARKFRAIAACTAGESAPVEKAPPGLPQGWEQVTDSANGFSVAMPVGSVVKPGPEGPVRSVTTGDTSYSVSVLPALKDKPSEKAFLHFLMKVQGRCSDKVKLDGFIEKAGRSSIHYKAHCPDKTDWDGMIFTNDQHLFLLSAQAPFGKLGVTEPFFYQFELNAR